MVLGGGFLEAIGANRVSTREEVGQVEWRAEPVGTESAFKVIDMECFHCR